MNNLIETIKKYQQDKNLSDNQFAKLLGIDRSTWAYIKSGKRNPGMKFLRAIAHELPQLSPSIYEEITDTTLSTDAPQTHQNSFSALLKTWWAGVVLRAKKLQENSHEV